jgi:hypothetical protein
MQTMNNHIILSIFLIVLSCSLPAQDSLPKPIVHPLKKGISFGVNLVGPVSQIIDPSKKAYEFSVNVGAYNNVYFTAEAGFMNTNKTDSLYKYKANGSFLRIGADYNVFKKNSKDENNLVFIGMRYGIAQLSHEASDIVIHDLFWGDSYTSLPTANISAQWFELTGGLRVEILKNVYMGWAVSYRLLITSTMSDKIKPFTIPGYGNGSGSDAWGFNYSIFYTFPFKQKPILN